ncbi:SDR family NAD(P)-dependent oxidoreductase [Haloflavibacter putidus]|uniref:SDR family NAD(P)-dependent oxidoreductase n=1 Tax=Haloflavibacter putidus TaxID=2576776 RepID=A0A508A3W3_9FLAO|nr:SDR family NAD(P)-dependent oxidoreductase [Haloflavibacter putidus]TQD40552.1 SDR family NAD(P)-dependent oxidoreductase [Haloflavibacter putidus]
MPSTVLITGATSGIGKAVAERLAQENFQLVLCGRRLERLEKLEKELSQQTAVLCLNFDVRDKEELQQKVESLPEKFQQIDILINNAANAHGKDLIQDGNTTDWDAMIDINIKGLLYMTKAILPGMLERKKGHILHIGSTAGKEVYPTGNVYSATKHAVDAINKSMRLDLNGTGVKVGAINPGLVETEFSEIRFKGDKEKAKKVYEGYTPLQPKDVAEIIHFMLTRPAHVNIADLMVMCTDQASSTIIDKK